MTEERIMTTLGFGDALVRWLKVFRKGQLIVVEGQDSHTFVILRRGIVGIYKDGQKIAAVSEPGSYLGEMSYLLDSPRTATMRAETDVEAYVMPSETFNEILAMAPQIGMKIMQSLAGRLRTTTSETALQRRQIDRLRGGGGAAPDIRTTTAEREGERYSEIAMGEIIFLLRTAIDFEDGPVLRSLLNSAILTDLTPAQVHHVPERERLMDLLVAIRGDKSRVVDLKTLIARVKSNCVTPVSTPDGSAPSMPSIVPGQLNAAQVQKMVDAEEARAEAKSAEGTEPASADDSEANIGDPFGEVYDGQSEPSGDGG